MICGRPSGGRVDHPASGGVEDGPQQNRVSGVPECQAVPDGRFWANLAAVAGGLETSPNSEGRCATRSTKEASSYVAAALSVVYRYGSAARQRYRSVVLGAALAVVAWAVASVGFSIYLANFADYGVTYGSLGAAVGLLFYLYLSATIVLVGAEVNAEVNAAINRPPADRTINPDARSRPGQVQTKASEGGLT